MSASSPTAHSGSTSFSLGETPLLTVGDVRSDALTLYEVAGGFLAADDLIIVANAGSHEILYVDLRGVVVGRVGRQGQGPGEFGSINWLQARADGGIHVGDALNRRVSAFSAEGELMWTRAYDPPPETPAEPGAMMATGLALHATDVGELLAFPSAVALPDGEPGLLPLFADLRLYAADGTSYAGRGRITVITWYEDPTAGSIPLGSMLGGPRLEFSGHSGRFAYTEGTSFQIDVFDGGARTMRIREDRARVAFEPDSVPERYVHVADSIPAYQDVMVDSGHRIWVRAAVDAARSVTEWRVFGPDGRFVGMLTLPERAEVMDATADRVLLLTRGELDVESIELWALGW